MHPLYMLKELINLTEANCKSLKIKKDNKLSIKKCIKSLKNVDLIITTGGVSVGKKDLVKKSLEEIGMKTKFWKVKVRPGKPILFGLLQKTPVFGLPGNPVSSYVCFLVFVLEAINKLQSNSYNFFNKSNAFLLDKITNNSMRETYFRGKIIKKNNKKFVQIFNNQDSSLMKTLSNANCLIKIEAKLSLKKNTLVEVIELKNGI